MSDQRILHARYRVDELIGRGGMADVHRGHDLLLNRTVAVKMMRPDLARDPRFQARFRDEARNAAALNHPNIVAVYDTGTETLADGYHQEVDCPYLVMEHVDGRTLREVIHEGTVPWRQAVEWTRGVLEALEHAHQHRIIHRDVKPANVMVTRSGGVKVMDFGIARALSDTSSQTAHTQAVVGTALYLPPEQAQGRPMDARSDLYAVGCVLFELLTGRPPFTGETPLAVAYQHVREEAPVPSQVDPGLPPAFDPVLRRALQKDPADRPPDAPAFLEDLEEAAAHPCDGGEPVTAALPPRDAVLPAAAGDVPTGPLAAAGTARPDDAVAERTPEDVVDSPSHAVAGAAVPGAPSAAQLAAAASVEGIRSATGTIPVVAGPATDGTPVVRAATGPTPAVAVPETAPPSGSTAVQGQGPQRPGRRPLVGALVAALALLLAALGTAFVLARGQEGVDVPVLAGLTQEDAVRVVEDAGLRAVVQTTWDAEVPAGRVAASDPAAGTAVERDSQVRLTVSRGPGDIVLPASLRGASEATARSRLEALGLTVSSVEYTESGDLERGQLVDTDPVLGSTVDEGTAVALVLSDGTVRLPDLRGMTREDATATLDASAPGLEVRVAGVDASDAVVVGQDPTTGMVVDNRSALTLTLSDAVRPTASASLPAPSEAPTPAPRTPTGVADGPTPGASAAPAPTAVPGPAPTAAAPPSDPTPDPDTPSSSAAPTAPSPSDEPTDAPRPDPTTTSAPGPSPDPSDAPTPAPPSPGTPTPTPGPGSPSQPVPSPEPTSPPTSPSGDTPAPSLPRDPGETFPVPSIEPPPAT